MDPHKTPEPYSATYAHHHPRQSLHRAASDDSDYTYTEKDAPVQQSARNERGSKASSNGRAHDSVISHPFSPKQSNPPSPTSSISSVDTQRHRLRDSQIAAPVKEKHNIQLPPQAHLDPEKQALGAYDGHRSHRHSGSVPGAYDAVYDKSEYHEKNIEDKAWQLLFYLSGPCALLSIVITLWTILALLVSLVLAPLRLCTSTRPPLSTQLATFLVPALNLQLHLVYSHNASQEYSAPMLIVIHLFSPVVAFGVAIGAWTAAGFWFFSSILGDPGGHDGHNDGKESILGVRNWWERWLSRGLR